MKSWSRSKKVIGILGILVFVFLTAYVVKNIDLYNYDEYNSYTNNVWKRGNYFYVMHYYNTSSSKLMEACIIKVSKDGKYNKVLCSKASNSMTNHGDNIYYIGSTGDGIYTMKTDGSKNRNIYSGKANNIRYYKGFLYFISDNGINSICRINTNGGGFKTIVSEVDRFIFNKNKIYFSSMESRNPLNIKTVSINGGEVKRVCRIPNDSFAIKDDKIYYMVRNSTTRDDNSGFMYEMNLDGTENKKILDKDIYNFNILNNNIYLYDTKGKCYRTDLKYKNCKYINSNAYVVSSDDKKIYYINGQGNKIYSMYKDGGNSKIIFDFSNVK